MPTFYQRIQNAIKGFNQDTNPNYNKFIYSTMGNNVIANNQNDDNFISKGYQKIRLSIQSLILSQSATGS